MAQPEPFCLQRVEADAEGIGHDHVGTWPLGQEPVEVQTEPGSDPRSGFDLDRDRNLGYCGTVPGGNPLGFLDGEHDVLCRIRPAQAVGHGVTGGRQAAAQAHQQA